MDLEKIIEKIDEYKNKTYSETKIVNLSKELKNYSKDDDGYYNRAIELYIASKSLYLIQNANCFKYSFREFSMINKLVLLLLKLREKLSLSEQEVQFLNGILYFRRIHELEKKLTENLERELKEASEICIYNGIRFLYLLTLCAFVEHLVVKKMMSTDETSLQNDIDVIEKNELDDYGVEEIVSSLGIIIDTLNSLPDLKDLPNFIFANRVLTKRTRKILLLACRIRRLQELQQNEEYFGYMCESKDKEFNMISNDINENILSDYRIGYIKRESATFNFDYSKEKISTIEIIDYMKKVSELEKCSNPVRYRLRVAEQAIKKLCEVGELTKEEKNNLDFETEELNVNKEYYLKPFYRDLTLLDYIRLRRLFAVFYYLQVVPIYKKFINGEIPEEEYFNSIIPSFKKESFKCLCDIFGEKIDAFWEVSCYKETNSKIIDLYYQPAIPGNSESSYYLLSSIANHSNFGRNIFTLLKKINSKCINEDGTKDVLVSILTKNFDKIGIPNFNGKDIKGISDIDFAFVLENVVYIAECKKNYHPTDIFECRTTLDAIHKAERQLSRIMGSIGKGVYRKEICKKFNLNESEAEFVPFIITSNRIFSNSNAFKYPVRYFKELIRFVEEGTINIGEKEIFVRDNAITKEDMAFYLGEESPYMDPFKKCMKKCIYNFKDPKFNINTEDYYLDIEELNEYCAKKWDATIFRDKD